jgi:hypothetical protein
MGGVPAAGLRPIDPAPFRLRHEPGPAPDGETVALDAVLADLDREIRPFGRRGAPWAAWRARGLVGGFRWDREDSRTTEWYPQGVAASADGRVLLASWYRKGTNEARVSVVDTRAGRYRHLALVTAKLEPVRSHAGGLAWSEDVLYVADTATGLRHFELGRILRTAGGYALPEAGRYRSAGGGLRFSFTSVDHAAHGLLVGEYRDKQAGARLVRWPLAPGGLLAREEASHAWVTAHSNLQGAAVLDGRVLLARSRGRYRAGVLYVSPFAEHAEEHRWALGGEDLAASGDELVSLSEHPDLPWPLARRRAVFRVSVP